MDHGNLFMILLKPRDDIIYKELPNALLIRENSNFKKLEKIQLETVVSINGKVVNRSDETINNEIDTGEIEVSIKTFKIIGSCKELLYQFLVIKNMQRILD